MGMRTGGGDELRRQIQALTAELVEETARNLRYELARFAAGAAWALVIIAVVERVR